MCVHCVGEILIVLVCIVICESVIVKFYDWQAIVIGASDMCLCLSIEWGGGRWADGHMGPGAQ